MHDDLRDIDRPIPVYHVTPPVNNNSDHGTIMESVVFWFFVVAIIVSILGSHTYQGI